MIPQEPYKNLQAVKKQLQGETCKQIALVELLMLIKHFRSNSYYNILMILQTNNCKIIVKH